MKARTEILTLTATLAAALCAASCSKASTSGRYEGSSDGQELLYHEEIVLGPQLENPYTVQNVKSALDALYPGTRASASVSTTDLYVRFLPDTQEKLESLRALGITLLDHPMDYTIAREGDWYHDPDIDSQAITWQYAVVPAGFSFPEDIRYELLDECYLAENDPASKSSAGIDWDAVEAEAFRQTGNASLLCPSTRGGGVQPTGRITLVDPEANGGQPVGVPGVKVQCNVFIKFASAFTDSEGYYELPKKYSANPRYRLVFENSKGFTIGLNTILYKGSISTIGKNPPEGVSVNVDSGSDRKLFRRCCVNNAAWDFYERCSEGDLNIQAPPSNLCFWCFEDLDVSSAIMLHHGTIFPSDGLSKFFRIVAWVVRYFGPDITLGTKNLGSYSQICSTVNHEMAHAAHFAKVGTEWWNDYIYYIALCAIVGQDTYGDGTLENAGKCAVGEMWAYYMQNRLYSDRYGSNPSSGSSFWFHPQILTSLQDRGLSCSQIFAAYDSQVDDKESLKQKMIELYPYKSSVITQIFNRYD